LLEDKIRAEKVPTQTAIPTGAFTLKLNTQGAKNVNYKKAFGKLHQGMIEITGIPNFSFVYIHTGNTIKETAGCPLCGFGFTFTEGEYVVTQSVAAYKMVYPKLVNLAKSTKIPSLGYATSIFEALSKLITFFRPRSRW
jgi:hypothetical protein